MKRSLREDLGLDASAVFSEFDKDTLGVASIGQVHRAVLSPEHGGKEVVVKVQAPGIERRFRADIQACALPCAPALSLSLSISLSLFLSLMCTLPTAILSISTSAPLLAFLPGFRRALLDPLLTGSPAAPSCLVLASPSHTSPPQPCLYVTSTCPPPPPPPTPPSLSRDDSLCLPRLAKGRAHPPPYSPLIHPL